MHLTFHQLIFKNRTAFLIVLLLFNFFIVAGQGRISAPVNPATFTNAADFSVQIDGKNTMVYASPLPADFCSFVVGKPVQIKIKSLTRDVKWVDVRPYSAGIRPIFGNSDSMIYFTINKPGQYSVELNGGIKIPLFLFGNVPEKNKPNLPDSNVLFFEAGKIHYPGTIILTDNKKVYIEEGAIVVGSIRARNARHIKIYGRGILDGSYGKQFMDSLALANHTNGASFEPSRNGGGNGLISLNQCSDVLLDGIVIYNSKTWDVVPTMCRDVSINNIKIVSDNGGDDGIDIVSTKNITIANSFVHTKDDCIAIKSFAGIQQTAVPVNGSVAEIALPASHVYGVDTVIVKTCVFWNALWGNALEIGFELSGDVKNVRFLDNDIIHVEGGAAFSIHNARRAVVSDILVDGLRVEGTDQKLFDLSIFRSIYSDDGLKDQAEINKVYLHGIWDNVLGVPETEKESRSKFRGYIKNITLKNVSVVDGPFPFSVFCGADMHHQVENIIIENLTVHGKKITSADEAKFYMENTSNVIVK
ncbi:MAG: glycosyl hydrolase family 28 protein [Chitinophagaceae bacterium]